MPTRRDILYLSAAAVAMAPTLVAVASSSQDRKTYVLVHGAGHGGWCWRDVRRILRDAGHEVFTPTMTGLGERIHLRSSDISIETHITDIVNVIEFEELDDVILVGHSYGARIVTGVADRIKDQIRHLVLLDGTMPLDGEPTIEEERAGGCRAMAIDGYLMPNFPATAFGIPRGDTDKIDWVNRRLTEHMTETFLEPINLPNAGGAGLPKTFIRCTDPPFRPGDDAMEKRIEADPDDWTYVQIATGHDAMVTAPEELSEILLGVS
jgi:pimeloyl-ACP methyl ester carboxylesterase